MGTRVCDVRAVPITQLAQYLSYVMPAGGFKVEPELSRRVV